MWFHSPALRCPPDPSGIIFLNTNSCGKRNLILPRLGHVLVSPLGAVSGRSWTCALEPPPPSKRDTKHKIVLLPLPGVYCGTSSSAPHLAVSLTLCSPLSALWQLLHSKPVLPASSCPTPLAQNSLEQRVHLSVCKCKCFYKELTAYSGVFFPLFSIPFSLSWHFLCSKHRETTPSRLLGSVQKYLWLSDSASKMF